MTISSTCAFLFRFKSRSYFQIPASPLWDMLFRQPSAQTLYREAGYRAPWGWGFQMCCINHDCVNHNIPVSIILLNNASLGLVRKNQFYNYAGRFIGCEFTNPDYRKLAESFNIKYFRVSTLAEAESVFKTADFRNDINLIELILDKDEYPRYSSGR
jgi:hypothetical protein